MALLLAFWPSVAGAVAQDDSGLDLRPNIVLIVADDLGYSDVGSYGGEIATPHLDRLAAEGLRFRQFYNSAKCEPTRASLMSGLYWQDTGLGVVRGMTLGEALRHEGYATFAVGKWHLKGNPVDRGFDRYFGHLGGSTDYFLGDPSFRLDGAPYKVVGEDFYATDAFTERAIEFIEQAKVKDATKPFFLYVAYNAPHSPLQAPSEDIAKYQKRYVEGWDAIREQRYRRQLELGIVLPSWPLSARPDGIPAWSELSPKQRRTEAARMAVYAAMVDRMDQNIGRLMARLESWQTDRRTLVMFMSDNGASPFDRMRRGRLGTARSSWETGIAWANASNTPFRLYKRDQFNGGTVSPLIVHWPEVVVQPGAITDAPGHVIDVMATLVEAAGGPSPKVGGEGSTPPPPSPGRSLIPTLRGLRPELVSGEARPFYFQLKNHKAIVHGDWKLVSGYGEPWELYHTSVDRTETRDLAAQNPERVAELDGLWQAWWAERWVKRFDPSPRGKPVYVER